MHKLNTTHFNALLTVSLVSGHSSQVCNLRFTLQVYDTVTRSFTRYEFVTF